MEILLPPTPPDRDPQKTTKTKKAPARNVWARTQFLVEVLLEVMEREMHLPDKMRSEQWLKSFGAKDSAVVNLQKLVDVLSDLQRQKPARKRKERVAPVNEDELLMLADWMRCREASAANVSPEAE